MCTGTIAFVRGPTVAKKVCETVITSSPGPTPIAFNASSSAVVPLDTATHSLASQALANSCSNASVSGPLMKTWLLSTRSIAVWISRSMEAYWAFRSTSGSLDMSEILECNALPSIGARYRGRLQDLDDLSRFFEIRNGFIASEDALHEVPALRLQRLHMRQARDEHVAGALDQPKLPEARELAERTTEMLAVDPGVVACN